MDISGGSMEEMTTFAKDILEPRLENLPEVKDILLSGLIEEEVVIELKREEMEEQGIEPSRVVNTMEQVNVESTVGELTEDDGSPTLRWNTSFEDLEQIENLQIPSATGVVPLKEVANVSLEPLENASSVWKEGSKDFIFVQAGRTSDVTQIEMAEAIREELKLIKDEEDISGFAINEIVSQADYVKDSIDGVTSNILIGGILAIVILSLFLRNIRATFIAAITIPTSLLLTFAAMWFLDYSVNILTLIGLGLGIGMMVDASIVILESIYRKKEQGGDNLDSVLKGTKEVGTAVLASMLTTIVVFLPIGLLGGEIGEFMILLSVVVAVTLISSVIVSFTVIPSLADKILKVRQSNTVKLQGPFTRKYSGFLSWIVRKKRNCIAIVTLFIFLFAGSFFLVSKVPLTIMPDMYNRYAEIMIDLETGITGEERELTVQAIADSLQSIQDVETNYVMDNGGVLYAIINMTKDEEVTRDQKEVNEEIFSSLRSLEDSTSVESVHEALSAGGGAPVQVNIRGEDFNTLQDISDTFIEELKGVEGIVGVQNSIERTSSEEVIVIKKEEVKEAGLSLSDIKFFMDQNLLDTVIGEVGLEEESVPLHVRWEEEIVSTSDLLTLSVPLENNRREDLSSFVELSSTEAPNEISRNDGDRIVSITADIEGTDLGSMNREVQSLVDSFDPPAGYSLSIAGDLEQQQELIQEMLVILGISIFLVYLVMAVQFNHLIHPLIIMTVIPMTMIGVIIGLLLSGHELSVLSGMGLLMLIGIVLNNAILFVDRTNQLQREGYSVEDSLIEAGRNRLRPILMTTLTTVGGMLPLALASGTAGNYQSPLATVIISGLLFSTLLTLILIPAIYRLTAAADEKIATFRKGPDKTDIHSNKAPKSVS
ncbi:efflux RND transporter permease subunit [Thalassobacillus sp. C254]|uniref:efflux RND transporter permease subunit n=1 Tax=Thalassobacillus sp. C254 TaxID=1225341 RepID=UPI0022B6D4DA|nr:efflux RND transporter permease subunit [Thalassobacillus sp. C254]